MNYSSDELFDTYFLKKQTGFNDFEIEKIVEDLLYIEDLLEPYGILEIKSFDELVQLKVEILIEIHLWQNELFAIKHFRENSGNPPKQNIFGITFI